MEHRLRLAVALSALWLGMAPSGHAYAGVGSGPGMQPNGANAKLPDTRNNLQVTRSLTDFGAKCDGTTDDQAAFAAATTWLKTAASRVVRIPAKTCVTSQTVTYGDGVQQNTTLTASAGAGTTSLSVASIANINNGDKVVLVYDDGTTYGGTVNGAPSGAIVTVAPAIAATASSGAVVFTGRASSYDGGGFVGFGSGETTGACVSTIKYTGAAAATTTLTATAASGALTLTVASTANMSLDTPLGIDLDDTTRWWTTPHAITSATTVAVMNEMPSQATSGNAVTIANNPVLRLKGPLVAPVFKGLCLDANNLAAVGADIRAAEGGEFKGNRGLWTKNYTGIGFFLHSMRANTAPSPYLKDNDFELYAVSPQNTKTIGVWALGGAGTGTSQYNIACSRNRFHGGHWAAGGNDASTAGLRLEFCDSNTLLKSYTTKGTSGSGVYLMPSWYRPSGGGFPVDNIFFGASLIGNIVNGTATGGAVVGANYFSGYGVSDGEAVPWYPAIGTTTGTGEGTAFGFARFKSLAAVTTARNFTGYSTADSYIFGLGRNDNNGLKVEAKGDIQFFTGATDLDTGSTLAGKVATTGGWQIGAPTGGDKGAGTLNAQNGVYVGGVALHGKATSHSQPANPTGTTSATAVHMGLAGAITPAASGKVLIVISGDVWNNTTSSGASFLIRYGTGAAPVNGAAQSGTACSAVPRLNVAPAANSKFPFSVQCIATGLSVGTPYWIDLALAAITSGTAAVGDISISAAEL